MNREDIIRMAREAGFPCIGDQPIIACGREELERFAALVASAERERIKQANAPEIERINAHIKELEDAVKNEREVCAKLCDGISAVYNKPTDTAERIASQWCADVIRARGQA